ncbi:MAG TPA: serine hydrolase [Candidatus Paceibacterota bacterium]|nr:serine hydrolase [Candidatus Paceibacterota bacterium]
MASKQRFSFARIFGIGFVAGGLIVGLAVYLFSPGQQPVRALRESDIASSTGYEFTDPLIGLTSTNAVNSPQYSQIQTQVQDYVDAQKRQGDLFSAAVKFSDIEASQGFTINPTEQFDPASLTKVPLAMAYYTLAESDPSVLDQTVPDTGIPDLDAGEQVESPAQLVPGQTYTVNQLIDHMIRYSDNNAEQLLANHLAKIGQLNVLSTLFSNLGIPVNPDNPDDMTVQQYSLFLRVLFNATYLDRNYSEQLLKLMSETDFSSGIDSGVPNNIVVSEKFGDARIPNAQGQQVGVELQNCGIVYYPQHPYLLCIMTKGNSIPNLEHDISEISNIVYTGMESKYQQN